MMSCTAKTWLVLEAVTKYRKTTGRPGRLVEPLLRERDVHRMENSF